MSKEFFITNEDEAWDLLPENFPHAAKILKEEFFWDLCDEAAPFGSDEGYDALIAFLDWRKEHPRATPIRFVDELLRSWGYVSKDWDVVEEAQVQHLLETDIFGLRSRDEAMIATSFAQFLVDAKLHNEVKRRALLAIHRQSLPSVIEPEWQSHAHERLEKLQTMKAVLEKL